TYEAELLTRLTRSTYTPLAQAAVKIAREERFHLRHSSLWLERLAHGTTESRERLVRALASAWPLLPQLLAPMSGSQDLTAAGMWPDPGELREPVLARAAAALRSAGLSVGPLSAQSGMNDHRGTHLPRFEEFLDRLQSVARADPEAATW